MPVTRYASAGDVQVAYQVVGAGRRDLVFVTSWSSHVEIQWEEPLIASFLTRLGSLGRLVLFDKRGVGMSDPFIVSDQSTLEEWVADIDAVLDAIGSRSAHLIGFGAGGPLSVLYTAVHPERVASLVLINAWTRLRRADDYPFGIDPSTEDALIELMVASWGVSDGLDTSAPSLTGDVGFRNWHRRHLRLSSSPSTIAAMQRMLFRTDVRDALPSVRCPTLVVHRRANVMVPVEHGRYIAARIPTAELVELEGADHPYWAGDSDEVLAEIEHFVAGRRTSGAGDRLLATVVFTDLVASTGEMGKRGDVDWESTLARHDRSVGRLVERFRGRLVNTTGDGMLALFDSPSAAVACTCGIRRTVAELGLQLRAGIHTGEVQRHGDDVTGIAVVIAARVAALAGAEQILATSTVRELAEGSAYSFEDIGPHDLKGIVRPWNLFTVEPLDPALGAH
jgi:class 3 adenylate cyclase